MPTKKHQQAQITNGPEELTLREVAEILGLHRAWLYRLKDRGLAGEEGGIHATHTKHGWVVSRAEFERFKRARKASQSEAGLDTLTKQALRRIYGRIGGRERAAFADPREMTARAREEQRTRWEREVDPDGTMDPGERARRVDYLQRAQMDRVTMARLQRRQGA